MGVGVSKKTVTGLDLHVCPCGGGANIKVATSVCTGGRNCPPDSSTAMGSSPLTNERTNPIANPSFTMGFIGIYYTI